MNPELVKQIDATHLPVHIAIIMDGNGRWAKLRGLERTEGHVAGVESVRKVTECAARLGVKYLTLYAFSTENWNRPREEVDALLHLIVMSLRKEVPHLKENNVSLRVIGDIDRMPAHTRECLEKSIEETSVCDGTVLNLALSYSSRWEITDACRRLAREAAEGRIDWASIDAEAVASHLSTAGIPDPDLLIRTGGDERVSNFLLWQIAYSELYFTDIYWPDFGADQMLRAIIDYQGRERRFGLTSEQVSEHGQQ